MILFYNVCITPDKSSYKFCYNRGLLPNFDKIDILKYSISSLAVIPWDEVIINVELTSFYKVFEKDIEEYVNSEFSNVKFKYSKTRAKSQKEWQKYSNYLCKNDKDVIFYCGNHDHIFLSSDLEVYHSSEKLLKESSNLYDLVCYSHRSFWHNGPLSFNDKYALYQSNAFDAMICSTARSFWEFWHSFDLGNKFAPRSDWANVEHNIIWNIHSYHKIFCEHFDGSGYSSCFPINNDPPQVIPPGFFESDIKINFGLSYKNDFFNINPFSNLHRCMSEKGADAFWTLDDIPLFWKKRISKIEIDSSIDLQKAKNHAILKNIISLHPYIFIEGSDKKLQLEIILRYKNILFQDTSIIESFKEGLHDINEK